MNRMDSKFVTVALLGVLGSVFSAAAGAQDPVEHADKIVLEEKAGSVMSSTGAQYETAPLGKRFVNGESMMLGDEAKATVVYYYLDRNGDLRRKCTEKYTGPETFIIDDSCKKGVWWTDGGSTAGATGGASGVGGPAIIVAAGVLGAAIVGGMDDSPVGPLSTGPNGSIKHL